MGALDCRLPGGDWESGVWRGERGCDGWGGCGWREREERAGGCEVGVVAIGVIIGGCLVVDRGEG